MLERRVHSRRTDAIRTDRRHHVITPPQPEPTKKPFWKKPWVLILVGILILGALGKACSGGGSENAANNSTPAAQDSAASAGAESANAEKPSPSSEAEKKEPDAEADAQVAVGQEFTIDDWSVTIVSVGEPVAQVGNEFLNTQAKGVFVPVTVTAQNVGKEARYFFADNFKLLDDQEREFKYSSEATLYGATDGSAPILDEVNPGTAVEGTLYFDVPADANLTSAKVEGKFFTKAVIVSLK